MGYSQILFLVFLHTNCGVLESQCSKHEVEMLRELRAKGLAIETTTFDEYVLTDAGRTVVKTLNAQLIEILKTM